MVQRVLVYRDDGSGSWEPSGDTLVTAITNPSVNVGNVSILLPDDSAASAVPFGAPVTYFVVFEATARNLPPSPSSMVLKFVTPAAIEDRDHDIRLKSEPLEAWLSTTVEFVHTVVFADDLESGGTSAWSAVVP